MPGSVAPVASTRQRDPTGSVEPRRTSSFGPIALSVAAYVVGGIIAYWSAWSHGPSQYAVSAGSDPALSIWCLTWAPFSLLHHHNPLFSTYGNYPFGVNMALNTSTLPLGYLMAPVTLLSGPVVSYNVLCTLAPALAACSAYALIGRFTSWHPARFFGGLLYGFSPYVVGQGTLHLNLAFIALIPLILLVLYDIVVVQRSHPMARGAVLGILVVVQFFISTELLLDTILMGLIGVVVLSCLEPRRVRENLPFALKGLAAATAIAAALLAYPVLFMLAGPGHIVGPLQPAPQVYKADLLGSIVPDSLQRITLGSLTRSADKFAFYRQENGSYLGLPLVAFLVVTAIVLRRVRVVFVAAILGATAFVLSLGHNLKVDNHSYTQILLPEAILAKVPLLGNILPARLALFVTLFAAIILAVALDRMRSNLARRESGFSVVAPAALAMGLLVPIVPAWPYPMQATSPRYFTSPAATAIPRDSVALVYPFPDSDFSNPQIWQAETFFRFKMPGGRFLVPEPATGREGQSRHSLTDSVLADLAFGKPPPRDPSIKAAVVGELRAWHVRTVLAAVGGKDPRRAISFLTWLLGQAPVASQDMIVWSNWQPHVQ